MFGIEKQLCCVPKSLYEFLPRYFEEFDIVIYSGVIYHVTDPLLSMRLIFSSLQDGGSVYLETYGIDSNEIVCKYEGPGVFHHGEKNKLNREGWNYFIPSSSCLGSWCQDVGFYDVEIGECIDSHIKGVAKRKSFSDFCRAGLSTPNCR